MFKITILVLLIGIKYYRIGFFDGNTTGFTNDGGRLENVVSLHMGLDPDNESKYVQLPNLLLTNHNWGGRNYASTTIGTKLGRRTIVFPRNYTREEFCYLLLSKQQQRQERDETYDESLLTKICANVEPNFLLGERFKNNVSFAFNIHTCIQRRF